jgi:hypothetical protein
MPRDTTFVDGMYVPPRQGPASALETALAVEPTTAGDLEARQRLRWQQTQKRRDTNAALSGLGIPLTMAAASPAAAGIGAMVGGRVGNVQAAEQARAARAELINTEMARDAANARARQSLQGLPIEHVKQSPAGATMVDQLPEWGVVRKKAVHIPPAGSTGMSSADVLAREAADVAHADALRATSDYGEAVRAARAVEARAPSVVGRATAAGRAGGEMLGRLATGASPALVVADRMSTYGDFMSSLGYLSALNEGPLERLDKSAEAALRGDPAKLDAALSDGLISWGLYNRLAAEPGP